MQKWKHYSLAVILMLSILNNIAAQNIKLLRTTALPSFPSASALELFQNRLFVIGDDAAQMLVLNTHHRITDSVRLLPSLEKRIAKEEKPDFESATILSDKGKHFLFIFSSFSAANRNKMVVLNLNEWQKKSNTSPNVKFADASILKIKEINIEGAAIVKNLLVLSNRANNKNKINELLLINDITDSAFAINGYKKVRIDLPLSKNVIGISGLTYCAKNDVLLFTASTENTDNAIEDGEIGESYIGYIKNFSSARQSATITVNYLMPLGAVFKKEKPQKIESIAVEKANKKFYILHLAADNDDGESTIFKIKWRL